VCAFLENTSLVPRAALPSPPTNDAGTQKLDVNLHLCQEFQGGRNRPLCEECSSEESSWELIWRMSIVVN